ncbi:MAG: hypothetical protein KDK00_01525 [Rhodobacteraceae bacterium]|nr:hypothetical protein [Paracoccaceae bacterium]
MRLVLSVLALALLAACADAPPDDGQIEPRLPISDEVVTPAPEAEDEATPAQTAGDETSTPDYVVTGNNPVISDTQDFAAVTERISIEEDKKILAAQREEFRVIAPTALPGRGGNTVNVAEFALKTSNKVGEKLYSRFNPIGGALTRTACKRYRLPDDAQEAFLKAGGPERDPKNLDPDGDGFACDWSPETYRKLVRN